MADTSETTIIACACGQKMRIPVPAQAPAYKCVKCAQPVPVPPEFLPSAQEPESPAEKSDSFLARESVLRVGEMLVKQGVITMEQLEEALVLQRNQGGKVIQLLLGLGHLNNDNLHAFLSRQPGLASIELSRIRIDQDLIKLIPMELAMEGQVLPVDRMGKLLTVAMACPLDTVTIREVEKHTGLRVKAMLCRMQDIHSAIEKCYSQSENAEFDMEKAFGGLMGTTSAVTQQTQEEDAFPAEAMDALRRIAADAQQGPEAMLPVLNRCKALVSAAVTVANSPAYGMSGRVENVGMALALLDKDGILALAQSLHDRTLTL